jgi:hypothetical protein
LSEPRRTLTWATPHPQPSVSCLSLSVFLCAASLAYLRGVGGGCDGGANSYDVEKAWSSINHSILSCLYEISKQINFIRIVFPGYSPFCWLQTQRSTAINHKKIPANQLHNIQ